jgi:hypothetical protein
MTTATITPTAAVPSGKPGTADAAPGAHPPYARGPQRPAPAFRNEAGAGVTPELRLTADHEVHPYLIQLHRGGRLLAYAVRSSYGWAICARTLIPQRRRAAARSGIATIGRTGHERYAVETALLLVAAARGGAW